MLITNHVLSGALVGALSGRIGTAVAAGVLSHFVLDAVPHFGVEDEHLMRVAVPDGLTGLVMIGVVAATTPREGRAPVLAGVFGACLPDLDKPGEVFFGRSPFPEWLDRFHGRIQSESPRRLPVEAAAAALLAAALWRAARR